MPKIEMIIGLNRLRGDSHPVRLRNSLKVYIDKSKYLSMFVKESLSLYLTDSYLRKNDNYDEDRKESL